MSAVISIIIVNYNAGELLRSCVDSLLNCSLEIEIIVVDNASTDGSLDVLLGLPFVQIIKNPVNVGFATACNIGINASSQPFVLFLNPDSTLAPGSLERLIEVLVGLPGAGMVGGMLCNPDGSEQPGGRRFFPTPHRAFIRAFGFSRMAKMFPGLFSDFLLHEDPLPEEPVDVEAISGACMLVKREAMDDVGLWDEGYFLHCEDLDWCMRFRQKGWRVMFVPDAKVIHQWGACSRSRPVFVEWYKHKGMVRFYRKFLRDQYPVILMWLVFCGVWLRFGAVAVYYTARRAANLLRKDRE